MSWTLPFFLMALVPPSLICVLATSLVPSDSSAVTSWRDHYFRIHRSFFSVYAASMISAATLGVLLRDAPLLHLDRVYQGIFLAVALIATFSSREDVHAVVALAMIAVIVLVSGTTLLRPGDRMIGLRSPSRYSRKATFPCRAEGAPING